MIRQQVQLTEAQAERLRDLSHAKGVSMARLVREAVDLLLASAGEVTPDERRTRILALAGRHASGCSDVSERHDEHLAGAIESRWRPS